MDAASHRVELARQFAAALDECDYSRAEGLLADECRYQRPGRQSLIGPKAICDSYRDNDAKAQRDFDSVHYRSDAAVNETGGIRLTFFDELRRGSATHIFRCSQIVYFDEDQKISRIELVEFPGERERLNEFCATVGIRLK